MSHFRTRLGSHGTRALVAEFIKDPDTWAGRVRRSYGRDMIRRLVETCAQCHFADVDRARLRRMHTAYARRSR